jgi:hypothetical protein
VAAAAAGSSSVCSSSGLLGHPAPQPLQHANRPVQVRNGLVSSVKLSMHKPLIFPAEIRKLAQSARFMVTSMCCAELELHTSYRQASRGSSSSSSGDQLSPKDNQLAEEAGCSVHIAKIVRSQRLLPTSQTLANRENNVSLHTQAHKTFTHLNDWLPTRPAAACWP